MMSALRLGSVNVAIVCTNWRTRTIPMSRLYGARWNLRSLISMGGPGGGWCSWGGDGSGRGLADPVEDDGDDIGCAQGGGGDHGMARREGEAVEQPGGGDRVPGQRGSVGLEELRQGG